MYRSAIEKLKKWKVSYFRKPLIIEGARQVGKTWLMKEFGKECYGSISFTNVSHGITLSILFRNSFLLVLAAPNSSFISASVICLFMFLLYHILYF